MSEHTRSGELAHRRLTGGGSSSERRSVVRSSEALELRRARACCSSTAARIGRTPPSTHGPDAPAAWPAPGSASFPHPSGTNTTSPDEMRSRPKNPDINTAHERPDSSNSTGGIDDSAAEESPATGPRPPVAVRRRHYVSHAPASGALCRLDSPHHSGQHQRGSRGGDGQASFSTNASSWRRLRHSYTPSVWVPYSPTIESPVFQ